MRIHSIMTGGTVVAAAAVILVFVVPAPKSQAFDAPPTTMNLTGTIRDFLPNANHPDFSISGSAGQGPYCMNVALSLDNEKRPVYGGPGRRLNQHWRETLANVPPNNGTTQNRQISWCHANATDSSGGWQGGSNSGGITSPQSFAQWFRDVPGTNMSRLWTIPLTWGNDLDWGQCWMYDTNNFNPIDNQLMGNDYDEKNFFFTYEIVARFTYDHDGNQFFWYKGDDDCWIFITSADGTVNRLVMDHGGIAGSREQTIILRNDRPGLGNLVDGQEYELRWYIAERKQPQSQFHVKTNVLLNTNEAPDAVLSAYD